MDKRTTDGWCILTTAGVRTLPLARALTAGCIDAWAPARMERRAGRGKKRNEVVRYEVAILPTFVFVRSCHVHDLLRAQRAPVNPYPSFRFLMDRGEIPVVGDHSLTSLRTVEERFRRSHIKTTKIGLTVGRTVSMRKGGFTGMAGAVKMGRRGKPVVDLGGFFGEVDIASYLIGTDAVQTEHQATIGLAA